ncbi:MAG: putative DNA binding domain-containing protein [Planctomycetes bacterium]|nr:putative DNA binding domain-containing protein [Planctomycetota bacterium]
MNIEKLKLRIAEGEGLTVEFKEKYTSKIDRDIVSFANTKGGQIILGVSDNCKIVGESLTNKMKAEIIDLARKCEPSIGIKKISRCDNLIVIEIPEGHEKPYSCSSGYFIRFDGLTQKMTQKEIGFLYKNAVAGAFEENICKDVTWEDISSDKIKAFFDEAKISADKVSPQDALQSLNLATKNGIKNAGVLFFAKEPRRHIIQCQMTLVAFKGTNRVHIYDRKDIQDDLWTQYREAMTFLEKHLNVRSEIRGFNRQDIYEIPLEALREAVANAIIHRDYTVRGTSIMVEVHEDRAVISNPGGFPDGMSEAKLGNLSIRRNELIADIFARMFRVERIGSGFKRIREYMDAVKLPFPVIESDSFFVIKFKRPLYSLRDSIKSGGTDLVGSEGKLGERLGVKLGERLGVNEVKIIELIGDNKFITIVQIAETLKISTTAVEKNIAKLGDKGLLRRIGPDKGGHWEVIMSHDA